jgi:3-deoxy-D-manno-octulosonate 8-phosphate phosphatase (KDO 8-P phosphatase)
LLTPELRERARSVRLLVLDVDGVLTDGTLYFSSAGEEIKAFNIQDGLGIKLLQASGVTVAIITGRQSRALQLRAENLGVRHLYQGAEDKVTAFGDLLSTLALTPAAVACMGDDLPDVPLMRRCGLAVSVPDAPTIVQSHAHYVTRKAGGHGAARELCELLMDAQGTLSSQLEPYLK